MTLDAAAAVRLPLALGLAAALVAGCGGGGARTTARSTRVVPPPRAPVDPCSVLRPRDVEAVLGAGAPAGRASGLTCAYADGPRGVQVVVAEATAESRAALTASARAAAPPARAVTGPGFTGLASPVLTQVQTTTRQAQVAVVGRAVLVRITVTGPRDAEARLVADAVRLGRAAGRSL